jgi:Spy/CpxP family protein refolding chaperone
MISIRTLSTVSLLGLLVAVAGCTGETGAATGSSTTAQETAAVTRAATDQGPSHGPKGHHRGGPDSLLVAALHAPLDLTAAQTATIKSALEATRPAAPPAFDKSRAAALAASIRSGKVDASSLQSPNATDMAARMAAHQAAEASALATLHATLTATQRRALVDSIAKREADHAAKHAANGGPKDGPMARGPHPEGHDAMGPMGRMLDGLDLTQAQRDAIQTKLAADRPAPPTDAERAAMKAQHEAFRADRAAKLQTFAGDTFDAKAFVAKPAGATMGPRDHGDRFAKDLAVVLSVLEAGQREKLAARIEAGPPAHMGRPGSAATPQ